MCLNKFVIYNKKIVCVKKESKTHPIYQYSIIPADDYTFSLLDKIIIIPLVKIRLCKLFKKWEFCKSHIYLGKVLKDTYIYEEKIK